MPSKNTRNVPLADVVPVKKRLSPLEIGRASCRERV